MWYISKASQTLALEESHNMDAKAAMQSLQNKIRRFSPGDLDACEVIYLVAFALWLAFQLLDTALVGPVIAGPVLKAVRYGCIGLLFFSELLGGRYGKRTMIWVVLAWIVCIGAINSGQAFYIDCVLFVFCARNVSMDKVLRVALWVSSIICAGIIICAFAGIIPNIIFGDSNRPRYMLGFRYMLFPSMIVFNITCIVVLLKRYHFSVIHAVLLFAANLAIYLATNARLSFILAIVAILAGLCGSLTKRHFAQWGFKLKKAIASRPAKILAYAVFPLCIIIMFALTLAFNPQIPCMRDLDTFLVGRLFYGHQAIETYGFTWFGQEITTIGNGLDASGIAAVQGSYNYIDSLYVKLFVQIGIIPALVFFGGFTALCVWAYKRSDWFLLAMLVILAVHLTIDDLSFALKYDILLLYLSLPLSHKAAAKEMKGSQ